MAKYGGALCDAVSIREIRRIVGVARVAEIEKEMKRFLVSIEFIGLLSNGALDYNGILIASVLFLWNKLSQIAAVCGELWTEYS